MSWSISYSGQAALAMTALDGQAEMQKVDEPEATIKKQTLEVLRTAIDAMPANASINVSASGSQMKRTGTQALNTLSVSLTY